MVLEILIAGGAITNIFYNTNKSMKMDEKALKKYSKAYELAEEATIKVKIKSEKTDKRVLNVAKKKRAIIEHTLPKFIEVYGQIQEIELENKSIVNEIAINNNIGKLTSINTAATSRKQEFTDKELVCGLMTKGIGKMMVIESERLLSAANNQMREANVIYSQAESYCTICDAIIARADRIANLFAKMNSLFIKSIEETKNTIEKNGLDIHDYTEFDKGILMTCINIAKALSDIIDVPVITSEGAIPEAAMETIMTGEKYLTEMSNTINTY